MALTSGFFNALNHDRQYEAVQVGSIFDGIIRDGVFATEGQALAVTASGTGLIVNVGTGRAWFNHTWTLNDAILPIEADEAEIVLDRIDALVLEVDASLSGRTNSIKFVKGTPSSTPVKPTLINTDEIHQYPLAWVSIKAEQTLIEQQDIENAIGTEATPFVTGILETVDVTMLIAQWQAQFEAMMRDDQQDFTNWEILTKAAYEAWFAGVQEQMEEDMAEFEGWEESTKTEFDSWFQNLQDELDENQAAHLQRQIGNLNALATSTKTDLVSAINEVNSRITTSISEILLDYDADLVGTVVTLSHTASAEGHTPESYEVTLVEPEPGAEYEVEQDVKNLGEWIISWTYQGRSYSETLDVHYYGYYHVVLHGGFSWRQWATTGGVSIFDHETLAELLADEKAVRRLCLVHASVDYFCSFATVSADQATIINNDIFAKWVSLSDYSMDKMEAKVTIKAVMDTADKYGYGEWALVSQIPTMTSNTAPYGEVSSNGNFQDYYAWKAFNPSETKGWITNSGTNPWIEYDFGHPVLVKKLSAKVIASGSYVYSYKIQGSNDGVTYSDVDGFDGSIPCNSVTVEKENPNNVSYNKWRFVWTSGSTTYDAGTGLKLQFYAWGPKGNVPVMTSNTAPYGEAIGDGGSSRANYMAFDGTASSWYASATASTTGGQILGYRFNNPVCVREIYHHYADVEITGIKIKYSDDGTNWTYVNETYNMESDGVIKKIPIADYGYHLYWDIEGGNSSQMCRMATYTLQFYGRELKVSVPTMTSNTAPYGEAIASHVYDSSTPAYKSFDGNDTTSYWRSYSGSEEWIQYDFKKPIEILKVRVLSDIFNGNIFIKRIKLQGSNDGTTWNDLTSQITVPNGTIEYMFDVENPGFYKIYRLLCNESYYYVTDIRLRTLQFYGKDYSEKEFANDGSKWLYDHGVELEEIVDGLAGGYTFSTQTMVASSKTDGNVILDAGSLQTALIGTANVIDLTNYDYIFASIIGGVAVSNASVNIGCSATKVASSATANADVGFLKQGLDISAVNANCYCWLRSSNQRKSHISEWWLE